MLLTVSFMYVASGRWNQRFRAGLSLFATIALQSWISSHQVQYAEGTRVLGEERGDRQSKAEGKWERE